MLVVRPVCYWRKNRTQRVCWGVVQMAGHPAVTREGIGSSPIAPATLCTLIFNRRMPYPSNRPSLSDEARFFGVRISTVIVLLTAHSRAYLAVHIHRGDQKRLLGMRRDALLGDADEVLAQHIVEVARERARRVASRHLAIGLHSQQHNPR